MSYWEDRQKALNARDKKPGDSWKKRLDEIRARQKQLDSVNVDDDIAPVREDKWVQGSNYFEDGYQFGDVYRTIDASAKDLEVNVMSSILGIGEKAVDLGATIVGGIGGLFNKGFGEDVKNFVAKDLYDADAIARGIVGARSVDAWFDPSVMNEENSVMGEKMDSLAQSGGEMIGAFAAGPYGNYVIGMNAFSGEVENAFQNGASYGEAIFSGAVSAAAEILTEKISGIKIGKVGTPNDLVTRKLVTGISNTAVRGLAKLGLDVAGEGMEEVLSETMGSIGRKLSYESEKNIEELLDKPEEMALFVWDAVKDSLPWDKNGIKEEFKDAFLGGAILGGVSGAGKFVDSKVGSKRDMTSGLTADEEKVFLQEYNESLAEKQKDGTKLTEAQKNALYESTMKRLEEGDIKTDKIESILGGDEYKAVQEATDEATRKAAQTKLTQSMYERVRDTKLGESYREQARAGQKLDMDLSQYNEAERKIVKKAMDEGLLNNTRKTRYMVDFVSRLAASKGVDFDFTDDKKLAEAGFAVDGAKVNGYYDTKTKTIGVNVESSKYLNTVVGHEITHVLEGTELYGKLQDAIFKYAQSKNDFNGRKEALKKFYKESDIDAELTADLVGEYLFTDSEFINRLYGTNRNVFQKIYDEIKYMLKLATAGSREARELERVKHAFEKAFKSAEKAKTDGEDLERKTAIGTAKYSLSGNAEADLHKALYDTKYRSEVLLRDESPSIMTSQNGVKNLPMVMQASHIRENVFTEQEAKKLGLRVDEHTHYHGLGEKFFLKVIDGLDDVTEAYRGTKNAADPARRENYFLLVSTFADQDGNTINVPVYINEHAQYNKVFIDVNKISTVFGRESFREYLSRQIKNKNLVRIKDRSTQAGERGALIAPGYGMDASKDIIPQDSKMSSGSAKKSLSDANLTQEQKTAFEEAKIVPPSDSIHYNLDAVESHREKLNKQFTVNPSASVVSLKDLFDRYDKIVDIWERLGGELNSKFLDEWNAKKGKDRTFTVFKAQAGYKYNIELSSMCKKGVPLFEAIDTIVKKEVMKELDTDTLGKAEKEILYDILKQHDFEIPCAICYVEQARQREGVIIHDFLNGKEETGKLGWNQVLMQVSEEMAKNGVNYTFAKVDRSIASDGYNPTDVVMDEKTQEAFYSALQKLANDEIVRYNVETREKKLKRAIRSTLKGTTPADVKSCFKGTLPANLKIFKVLFQESSSRVMLDADLPYSSMTTQNLARSHHGLYSLFNSQGGVSGYKTKQGTVVYWGDILDKKWEASKLRGEGGVRYQSNSDSQMYTLLDQAQMYMDFTAKGYYLQAYTKVLSQLKLFGLSRGKINASLIPAVKIFRDANGDPDVEKTMENAGLDENGELLFDDLEGIDHEEAFMLILDPEYSKSVGGVCIGYSDKHISKLLDDPRVQLIIGFHDKTNDTNKRYAGAKYAKNYNGLNEAVNSDGETKHIAFNKYVQKAEKLFAFDSKTETYSGSVNFNGKSYTANDIPRLAADLYLADCAKKGYTPAYQMFAGHQNYYKLLADFSLYDSNGQYAPHKKVAYDMPNQVPYLDENGEKQYMDTEKYIKQELTKEMQVRDSISEAMADTSEEGIIPQFIKRVNELHAQKSLSAEGSTQTRRGDLNITGGDVVRLQAPTADIAPVKAIAPTRANDGSVKFSVSAEEPTDTDEEIAPIAPVEEPTTPATDSTADTEEEKTAKVLTEEQKTENGQNLMSMIKNNFLDKGMVFEDLSLQTGNRELQAKWNSIRYAGGKAQKIIGEGNEKVPSLTSIREKVEKSGKTEQFYEYLYHKHNVDRMSLESAVSPTIEALKDKFKGLRKSQIKGIASRKITDTTTDEQAQLIRDAKEYLAALDVKNKPVFGDSVTSDVSKEKAAEMEMENPEFKETAKEVYDYMNYLRSELVKAGVITEETAKLWGKMYPHYVPIRRVGKDGASINVPLATNRTGINAPIKAAKGGNSDILPLFDTMALRTEQTYKAIAKNRFGVELKNTLNTEVADEIESVDDAIDSIDNDEALLQDGKNGASPTLTVFENGKRVTFEITDEMYDAIKPTSKGLSYTNKVVSGMSNLFRGVLTEYNPVFMVTNAVKDAQDILMNSQHARKTYAAIPKAIAEIATKGKWYQEYIENGGERNTYFDSNKKAFKEEDNAFKKIVGMPLRAISFLNNTIEQIPRLAEYIASREAGASVDVAMLDSARVTTNFAAGGDVTKFLNRNGFNFLNASTQGALQQVRNVREAKANGLKGWVSLATKVALAGVPVVILNALIWDDDEEYDDLSDYVKQNYYIVAKMGDGTFVRIPKGRALAVIQDALQQVANGLTGNDEVDLNSFLELAINNLAPNNPLENNLIAPIVQVVNNKTWYGDDLVPTRLQDLPNAEQYDESTDAISKWLGSVTNQSPYKINYLLDQYTGGVGDMILPMLTPEAESGDNSIVGNLIAPWRDKFTADSVMNNQNVTDFYEIKDKATVNANSMNATDEDTLKSKYMNSVSSEMSKLYQMKREIQNSDLSDAEKYNAVREIQKEIDALAKDALSAYENAQVIGDSAIIGDTLYEREDGQWKKANDGKVDIQDIVAERLSPNASAYWKQKSEETFAAKNPTKYAVALSAGGYDVYKQATNDLSSIKADKDSKGNTISGSRKKKVMQYIANLDIDYEEKLILYKSEYKSDNRYNVAIVNYLNNNPNISYEQMMLILAELGFNVTDDGRVTW